MTTTNLAPRKAAWTRAGTAVTATSAAEVASQAGLDWSVSLHDMTARYDIPVSETESVTRHIPVEKKKAVIKTTPTGETTSIGVVGSKYKVFQNNEIFSALDSLIDSSDARYAAAGEYDGGAKVWMLMSLPIEMTVANDPHSAFLLARTSHDGSSSVIIKPVIERLYCMNQINKIYKNTNKYTYQLTHTTNAELSYSDIRNILDLTYSMATEYSEMANNLLQRQVSTEAAIAYFKKVFPLPSKVELTPYEMLSKGEKVQRNRALNARKIAMNIYSESETQENIRGTVFGLWQSVVEYADYNARGKNLAVNTMAARNDGIKMRALEIING